MADFEYSLEELCEGKYDATICVEADEDSIYRWTIMLVQEWDESGLEAGYWDADFPEEAIVAIDRAVDDQRQAICRAAKRE